jgi:hypothetical protein
MRKKKKLTLKFQLEDVYEIYGETDTVDKFFDDIWILNNKIVLRSIDPVELKNTDE